MSFADRINEATLRTDALLERKDETIQELRVRLRAAEQERDELRKLLRRAWNEVGEIALANEIDALLGGQ